MDVAKFGKSLEFSLFCFADKPTGKITLNVEHVQGQADAFAKHAQMPQPDVSANVQL